MEQQDTSAAPIILFAIIVICLVVVFNIDAIKTAWRHWSLIELRTMALLPWAGDDFAALHRAFASISPDKTTWQMLNYVDRRIGLYIAPPVSLLLLLGAWRAWKARRVQSRRLVTIPEFRKIMGYRYPEPHERQAMTPEEWARFYRLDTEATDFDQRAAAALRMQLGMPSHAGRRLLTDFAESVKVMDVLDRAIAAHAYASTALLRLAAVARERSGVVPMRFMRPVLQKNRETMPYWFALSSLGRQTAFVEGVGIVAHYQAEMAAKKSIGEPQVGCAVSGLRIYFEKQISARNS